MSEKIVVGIDVSKKFSDICILSPSNEIIESIKLSSNKSIIYAEKSIMNFMMQL